MGIAARGSGTPGRPYAIDGYLQPFALEQQTLRSMTATLATGGRTIMQSTLRPDSTAQAAFVPTSGVVADASPARVVFVGYAEDRAALRRARGRVRRAEARLASRRGRCATRRPPT